MEKLRTPGLDHSNGKNHKTKIPPIAGLSFVSKAQPRDSQQQLHQLLRTIKAYKRGDFSVRCAAKEGLIGEISDVINDILEQNQQKAKEFARVARSVSQEGKMTERVNLHGQQGDWATSLDSVNSVINGLVQLIREVTRVLTSVARGDLSQKMNL